MVDWIYPETWQPGDTLNAALLNRRVRDQNALILRRPLTVAHASAAQNAVTSATLPIAFNVVDQDDDGMVTTDLPAIDFTAQRDGTYQIWLSVTFTSNGTAGDLDTNVSLDGGANRRWDLCGRIGASSVYVHNNVGTVYVAAGQTIRATAFQTTGANVPLAAVNNTPRIAIMWLGVS